MSDSMNDVEYLLSPEAIRARSRRILELTRQGMTHFHFRPERLADVVDYVATVIRRNYPDFNIPFHSRWRHFEVGRTSRLGDFKSTVSRLSVADRIKANWDLAIVSVLLDAGAGPEWRFVDPPTGQALSRSEGLGVASLRMFLEGKFSGDFADPFRADGERLLSLSESEVALGFQVSEQNKMVGLKGRVNLLKALGEQLAGRRPGDLFEKFSGHDSVSALDVLKNVLKSFGAIWPGRISLLGVNLGDVWFHPLLGDVTDTSSLIPFHKLSQWLTYSLLEPLADEGITVTGLNDLTGLAEYRNGGLMLDSGLIELKDPSEGSKIHPIDSEIIIEWRALTVTLLDQIAAGLREKLGISELDLPLVKVLEGGTWAAGRKLARERRPSGGPPLEVASDGTVF